MTGTQKADRAIGIAELIDARPEASGLYERWISGFDMGEVDPGVPRSLPGYFVDRFAFEVATSGEVHDFDFSPDQAQSFNSLLPEHWIPAHSIDRWTPPVNEPAVLSAFYDDLLLWWERFVAHHAIQWLGPRFNSVRGQTWEEQARASVFFPRMPAIPGAHFFDKIAEKDRGFCIARFGQNSPIDFFAFMLQVHEGIHAHQLGEPLVNELIQAVIWTKFLDFAGLWCFQRNSATGASTVLEVNFVRHVQGLWPSIVAHGQDSAEVIARFRTGSVYIDLCAHGHELMHSAMTYSAYLRGAAAYLR